MQVQITALHDLKLTPAIENHVHKKFAILEKHFNHINRIHVTLSIDNNKSQHTAKADLHLIGGKDVVADSTTKDMYASIDMLAKMLDEQIKKYKEKLQEKE